MRLIGTGSDGSVNIPPNTLHTHHPAIHRPNMIPIRSPMGRVVMKVFVIAIVAYNPANNFSHVGIFFISGSPDIDCDTKGYKGFG